LIETLPKLAVVRWFPILLLLLSFFVPSAGIAATMIYVHNGTDGAIEVVDLKVEGDPLSKKAWKKGNAVIPAGERVSILSINRTGKFNWMDPTPRFIEPGKTAVFTAQLRSGASGNLLTIKQKLFGTGAGSKLWYSIGEMASPEWNLPFDEISGVWSSNGSNKLRYVYRALKTQKDDNLELVINTE